MILHGGYVEPHEVKLNRAKRQLAAASSDCGHRDFRDWRMYNGNPECELCNPRCQWHDTLLTATGVCTICQES